MELEKLTLSSSEGEYAPLPERKVQQNIFFMKDSQKQHASEKKSEANSDVDPVALPS